MVWYKKRGFENNPLSVKPHHKKVFVGFEDELEKLNNSLESNKSVWLVFGEYGSGKTTLIKKLISAHKSKRIVYISHNRIDGSMNLKKFLVKKNSFFKRIFNIIPKDIILIIDEAINLNKREFEDLSFFYDINKIKNLILINPNLKNEYFKKLEELAKNNVLNLNKISKEKSVELIKQRLEDQDLISIEAINMIHDYANSNPRKILEFAEHSIRISDEIGDGRASVRHVNLLKEKQKKA